MIFTQTHINISLFIWESNNLYTDIWLSICTTQALNFGDDAVSGWTPGTVGRLNVHTESMYTVIMFLSAGAFLPRCSAVDVHFTWHKPVWFFCRSMLGGGGLLLLLFQGTSAKSWNNSLCNNALLPFALWPFQTMTISLGALRMSESSAHFDCAPVGSGIKKKNLSRVAQMFVGGTKQSFSHFVSKWISTPGRKILEMLLIIWENNLTPSSTQQHCVNDDVLKHSVFPVARPNNYYMDHTFCKVKMCDEPN